jgi:hypothetical protein
MKKEFLDLKLFGPQEILPLIKKYRKLKDPAHPRKKPALRQEWPQTQ